MTKFKTALKKGYIGEKIVKEYLLARGLVPYVPDFDGAHPFDFLCASRDKKNMVIADAKAKARMNKKFEGSYVNGINECHFEQYSFLSNKYGLPVWLFFIDEMEKRVYGNSLNKLTPKSFVIEFKVKTRMFRLEDMKNVKELNDEEIDALRSLSQRKYEYIP